MEQFNYLAVLISIILGLGMAQLLASFGRWVEHRKSFRPFAPAMVWAGILFVIHIQTWWSMFGLRSLSDWTFVAFAVVLMQPVLLYLLSILVLPSQSAPDLDVRINYFSQRRWFFGLIILLLVVSVLKDLVVSGSLPSAANLTFHFFFFCMAVVALSTARERVHQVLAILSAVSIFTYVGLLFAHLR